SCVVLHRRRGQDILGTTTTSMHVFEIAAIHVFGVVAWHGHARQFHWSQPSLCAHVPTGYHSLHLHRDRFDSSRVSWLRVLMERASIWETDRKTVRAQPSLTDADSKASPHEPGCRANLNRDS